MKRINKKAFVGIALFSLLLSAENTYAQKKKSSLTIPFGTNDKIVVDLSAGTYSVVLNGTETVKNAYAKGKVAGEEYDSRQYKKHKYTITTIKNSIEDAKLYTILHEGAHPLQQLFYVYPSKNYFVTELKLKTDKSNYLAPLVADNLELHQTGDNRALFVPFDNDTWVRYNASKMEQADFVSSEVSAFYNNDNNKGIIVGSLEQNVWKSGIETKGNGASSLSDLTVFSGFSDAKVTRDSMPHGAVLAENGYVRSAKFFVGDFNDWRDGMETFAQVKEAVEPRYIFSWKSATPMGWNSWGVLQTKINLEKAKSVVDFFADSCKGFRNADNTLFMDLDAFWDNMTPHGLSGDVSQLETFVNYCKEKGFKPGVYWTPFADWGKRKGKKIEGSNYSYGETWTLQNGKPFDTDNGRAMDPTHPGTKDRIVYTLNRLKNIGFEMIKIDFLAHGAAEGDKFYDPKVTTGMQAYKQGMEFLDSVLDGKMLVYAAISPNMATARYVHSRRIACDAFSAIDNTEYTLNSTGYGWWQNELYNFMDADHVVFANAGENVNRARFVAAVVTGALITGDDYAATGPWHEMAKKLLQNKDFLAIVKHGKTFRPIDANTDNKGVNLFTQSLDGKQYVAAFNYTKEPKEYNIPLERLAAQGSGAHQLKELFGGQVSPVENGVLKIKVGASDAVMFELLP